MELVVILFLASLLVAMYLNKQPAPPSLFKYRYRDKQGVEYRVIYATRDIVSVRKVENGEVTGSVLSYSYEEFYLQFHKW